MDEVLSALVPTLSLSSSSSSDVEEETVVNQSGFVRRFNHRFSGIFNPIDFQALRRDIWITCRESSSYFAVAFILLFYVSVAVIFCVYGPQNVWIGPNSSIFVDPNPFFVQSVKVNELDDSRSGLELFGFYKSPSLDVIVNWSESRLLSISPRSFKGWPYYLNNGASLNISYSVKTEGSSALLVVHKGPQHFSQPLSEEPPYQETAISWNIIRGSSVIELKITDASSYYVAVSNVNMKEVKVELDIDVRAVLYDTKQSSYKCTFSNNDCTFNAISLLGNSFVLTSPAPRQGASVEGWYIRFSYQPRLIGYLISAGLVMLFMLMALQVWKMLVRYLTEDNSTSNQRTRLLADIDEEDADLEGFMGNEDEASNNSIRRRCAICYDAPRGCFFLPCGHCISCYQCGTKVAEARGNRNCLLEAGGNCPICRREIMKVKRIFTV